MSVRSRLLDAQQHERDNCDKWVQRPPRSYADEVGRHLHERRGLFASSHQALLMGGAQTSDPNFSSVSILLPLNGTNGGTTFTDYSTNAWGPSRKASGTVTSTAAYKWGGSSLIVPTTADGLTLLSASSVFSYAADYSIEVWVYFTAASGWYLADMGTNVLAWSINATTGNTFLYNGAFIINAGSTAFNTGQWYFMQQVRSGSTITIARDGSSYQTATNSSTLGSSSEFLQIGNTLLGGSAGNGYLQDFRITKGIARSIAVPTAAFPTS